MFDVASTPASVCVAQSNQNAGRKSRKKTSSEGGQTCRSCCKHSRIKSTARAQQKGQAKPPRTGGGGQGHVASTPASGATWLAVSRLAPLPAASAPSAREREGGRERERERERGGVESERAEVVGGVRMSRLKEGWVWLAECCHVHHVACAHGAARCSNARNTRACSMPFASGWFRENVLGSAAQCTASQNISPKSTAPDSQRLKTKGCSGSTLHGNSRPRISQLTQGKISWLAVHLHPLQHTRSRIIGGGGQPCTVGQL